MRRAHGVLDRRQKQRRGLGASIVGVVFGLVPAGDDVQADSAVGKLIQSGELLCHHNGMVEGSVHSGKYLDVFRVRWRGSRGCFMMSWAQTDVFLLDTVF